MRFKLILLAGALIGIVTSILAVSESMRSVEHSVGDESDAHLSEAIEELGDDEAMRRYRMAAEQGDAKAQTLLGLAHRLGVSVRSGRGISAGVSIRPGRF